MTEMATTRSRIAALVVAALLAVAGAVGTEAFLTADDANALGSYPYCYKDVYGVWHCHG
jgi:hypothetical protein